ncbi:hypothetical protein LUZ61_001665 [Rhynchospora tenuis]|uniref:Pentatricopeptide repeat-containing protein n=1 Tax=Rhynchospora tenuis TaxID=198213 RepID=A0AAD6ER64_9POAL|nr:hypothetical protein LUZ61_001665 [Rhynchospora tenuis]
MLRLGSLHLSRSLSTITPTPTSTSPTDPAFLLRICTILFQHQHSPDSSLHRHLSPLLPSPSSLPRPFLQELFFQVSSRFPLSYRPLHRFLLYLHPFPHSSSTASRYLDILGKSRNMDLLWSSFVSFIPDSSIITPRLLCMTARGLADASEVNKIVQIFSLISSQHPSLCSVQTLNLVIRTICERKLVDVAKSVVSKVRRELGIVPNEETYRFLILGFCRTGELAQATKLWNKMVSEGLEPDLDSYMEVVDTLFKNNRLEDALMMFKSLRERRFSDLSADSYHAVITWLCKEGRMLYAHMLLAEMLKRGVQFDCTTLGELIYGLLVRRRTREAYRVFHMVGKPGISLYHGLMKGLLRMKRAGEATEVLREMLRRGCEPNMHTYIMLLQGHLGKRGRKGRDPLVNFESIFIGGLIKAGKMLEATKFVERTMRGAVEVPRFDYNKFLHCFSNEDGVAMFKEVGRRLKEVGMNDLGDIFSIYGERMATRDRRRKAMGGLL